MILPVSLPKAKNQPDQECYGVEWLALFETYTRETFRAVFGIDAPAWDPSRARKDWFDSRILDAGGTPPIRYQTAIKGGEGAWRMEEFTLPAAIAASVNLPGRPVYPTYIVEPTAATRGGAPVAPVLLTLESDARALLNIFWGLGLRGAGLADEGLTPMFPVIYPAGEARRMWAIADDAGRRWNAGLLWNTRNKEGIGSPGEWKLSAEGVEWIPANPPPDGLDDTRPPVAMPMRGLLVNEQLRPGLTALGALGVQVVRIDRESERLKTNGGFTEQDREMLRQVYQQLVK